MSAGIRDVMGARIPTHEAEARHPSDNLQSRALNPVDQLCYLADMVAELATMARTSGQDRLATILELARDETDRQLEVLSSRGEARPHP